MEQYVLAPEEVFLFRGNVTRTGEDPAARLVLTNLYLALVQEDGTFREKAPVANIKIYKEAPQIFAKGRHVEIYLTTGQIGLEFPNRLDALRFVDAAMELLTGKTKVARNAGKVKKALDDVNEAFGMDVLEEAKNFSVNTITQIVSNSKPSVFKLLTKKKQKKKPKELSK